MIDYQLILIFQVTALWWEKDGTSNRSLWVWFFHEQHFFWAIWPRVPAMSILWAHTDSHDTQETVEVTLRDRQRHYLQKSNKHNYGYKMTGSIIDDGCSSRHFIKDLVFYYLPPSKCPRESELLRMQSRVSSSGSGLVCLTPGFQSYYRTVQFLQTWIRAWASKLPHCTQGQATQICWARAWEKSTRICQRHTQLKPRWRRIGIACSQSSCSGLGVFKITNSKQMEKPLKGVTI